MVTSAQQKAASTHSTSGLLFFSSSVSGALMSSGDQGQAAFLGAQCRDWVCLTPLSDMQSGIRAPSASLQMTPAVDGLKGRDAIQRDFNRPKMGLCQHHDVQKGQVQGPAPLSG